MNSQDTFNIICSFLNPKELIKFRFLSSVHNNWTNIFLTRKFKKINIEEYSCPKCANWLDNKEDLSNYNEFSDYYLTDDIKESRFQLVDELINNKYLGKYRENVERSKILCDECECQEDYSDNIFHNFRYRGSREYIIFYFYSIYSWTALCLVNNDNVLWNEYKKPLSICYKEYIVSENSNEPYSKSYDAYDAYDTYDNDTYDTYDNDSNDTYDTYDNDSNDTYE